MVSKLRRLAADHAALHEELPPNYLFPAEDASSDDITQLTILLAGPQGTPFSQGLWRLHLKLPEDYPKSPPKATFKTRIWHPNVEESSGAVCVDTLKRDWKVSLTLKDVLITISCLLIYPNPDSALNSTAGALLQENYEAFARQAKLMTSIHAPIPSDMRNEVNEAKMRGEDIGTTVPEQQEETARSLRSRKGTRIQSVTMKKKPARKEVTPQPQFPDSENTRPSQEPSNQYHYHQEYIQPPSDDENENPATASKENDPSLSPSPVKLAPPLSPRKNAHGKRPLSVLTPSLDMGGDPFVSAETEDIDIDIDTDMHMDTTDGMSASERNIAANASPARDIHPRERERDRDSSPQRKSPKHSHLNLNRGLTSRHREESANSSAGLQIYEDAPLFEQSGPAATTGSSSSSNPLAELDPVSSKTQHPHPLAILPSSATSSSPNALKKPVQGAGNGSRKDSSGSGLKKAKPRVGIRRL